MPRLAIHLQHGFDDDEVLVVVDGEPRLHRTHLRSNPVLGLAAREELEVEAGPLALDVVVPTRGLQRHLDLDVTGDLHVGAAIQDGELRLIAKEQRFGYA